MSTPDERNAKRKRYTSRSIKLEVGAERTAVTVHENSLRQSSPFFRAALDKKWKEGATGDVELPDEAVDVVAAYVHWLYHTVVDEALYDSQQIGVRPDYGILVELYVFGENIQDDRFANDVMCRLVQQIDDADEFPGESSIILAYLGTLEGCPLRRILVSIWAESMTPAWFDEEEEYPMEFMLDLAKELGTLRGKGLSQPFVPRKKTWMKQK